MLATLSTIEGPQLTMDAIGAVKLLMTLPLHDYSIAFHPGGNVMHTPEHDPRQQEMFPIDRSSLDRMLRQAGAGGFIPIGSVCGKVYRGPRRTKKFTYYRHPLHAGR